MAYMSSAGWAGSWHLAGELWPSPHQEDWRIWGSQDSRILEFMARIWELQNENDCILTSENSESASQHMTVGRALQQHLVHFKEGGTEA